MTPAPGGVLVLATGDVIAYSTGPGRQGTARGEDVLDGLPAEVTAGVVVEDVLAEPSWDTSPATMLTLARRARAALVDDGFAGVVVTHGLDTITDTAYLADLVLGDAAQHGTVVFTGAARPRDALSADGPRNLASSIAAARAPGLLGAGAVLCLGDEVHAARRAVLVDVRSPHGMSSAPHPILARVDGSTVRTVSAPPRRPPGLGGEPETGVALIATYPGMDEALITTAVDHGSRGIVLEGTGAGNIPVSLFTTIGELTSWDIPTVIATRAAPHAVPLDELAAPEGLASRVGAIGAGDLPPAKARYALMAALSTGGVEECREWFRRL